MSADNDATSERSSPYVDLADAFHNGVDPSSATRTPSASRPPSNPQSAPAFPAAAPVAQLYPSLDEPTCPHQISGPLLRILHDISDRLLNGDELVYDNPRERELYCAQL